jgi:hypothetical protein
VLQSALERGDMAGALEALGKARDCYERVGDDPSIRRLMALNELEM